MTEPPAAEKQLRRSVRRAVSVDERVAEILTDNLAGLDAWVDAVLDVALPLVEARLREQIEHGAAVAAERHTADMERGGCSCGFCVWSVEHVVRMAIREAD